MRDTPRRLLRAPQRPPERRAPSSSCSRATDHAGVAERRDADVVEPARLLGAPGTLEQPCQWWDDCPPSGQVVVRDETGALTLAGATRVARMATDRAQVSAASTNCCPSHSSAILVAASGAQCSPSGRTAWSSSIPISVPIREVDDPDRRICGRGRFDGGALDCEPFGILVVGGLRQPVHVGDRWDQPDDPSDAGPTNSVLRERRPPSAAPGSGDRMGSACPRYRTRRDRRGRVASPGSRRHPGAARRCRPVVGVRAPRHGDVKSSSPSAGTTPSSIIPHPGFVRTPTDASSGWAAAQVSNPSPVASAVESPVTMIRMGRSGTSGAGSRSRRRREPPLLLSSLTAGPGGASDGSRSGRRVSVARSRSRPRGRLRPTPDRVSP